MQLKPWRIRLMAAVLAVILAASMILPAQTLGNQAEPTNLTKEEKTTAIPESETEEASETVATEILYQVTENTLDVTEAEPIATDPIPTIIEETVPEVTFLPTDVSSENELEMLQSETVPLLMLSDVQATEGVTEPADADARDDDLNTVSGHGISFQLFNYSANINKSEGNIAWRPISSYFTFRNSQLESGTDAGTFLIPDPSINDTHDQDGFTYAHATVERVLLNGFPVLDLSRNADGTDRTDPQINQEIRSLSYLFSAGDHAVTAYHPINTILQSSGSRYYYDSASSAVDYDAETNMFRLRGYIERNSTTAGYGNSYGDFLPFTYTAGVSIGTTADGTDYHVLNQDTDYWFGMTMTVNFYQTKYGKLGDQDMVFNFSGDDDVWVFVDDVLVLDLGGTHGTVDGSINFATGEVRQYLSWRGANATEAEKAEGSATSFPTTIRECFDAAGREPQGGWSADGKTFADFTQHTLQFFYLERGAAVANCTLDFRLPTLPDESLTVTKDLTVDADEAVRDYIADSVTYDFRVMKADSEGKPTEEFYLPAGTTYDLLDNGSKIGTEVIDEDGCFRLKAGQSAQFSQMLIHGNGATTYVVEEIMADEMLGQYADVDYLISGVGGDIITERNESQNFTAFCSGELSAEQTQTVIFRNRVDTSKLCTLSITKLAAPGTVIESDELFQIQVMLSGKLLPVGAPYAVGSTTRYVENAGILLLHAGETAILNQGILSGTSFEISEIYQDGCYRPSYEGRIQPSGEVDILMDGISGIFSLGSDVQVTVTNADYDFAVEIPITKYVHGFRESGTFDFCVKQIEFDNDWIVAQELPEQRITVADPQGATAVVIIGYDAGTEGVFYYKIAEKPTDGMYIDDDSFYIVEVTIEDDMASVTNILKNGIVKSEVVTFMNYATASLTVIKTVAGITGDMKFPFTVTVFLNGEPFVLPKSDAEAAYSVDGNLISFSLAHGETVTIGKLPIGAEITVAEEDAEGFQVFSKVGTELLSGGNREVVLSENSAIVEFINQSGFRLPNTGGVGTDVYTAGGAFFGIAAILKLCKKKGGKKTS